MRRSLLISVVFSFTAAAQIPPPILRLIRNPAVDSAAVYSRAGAAIEVLGARSTTGVGETWLIEQHPTFGSIEEVDKVLGSSGGQPADWIGPQGASPDEVLGPGRVMIAFYRDGWGYHSEDAVRMMPRARFLYVTVYRMRPDSDKDMVALMGQRRQYLDSINLNEPDLVYHVISGGASGLYLVLTPMVSLRTMDERLTKMPLDVDPRQAPASELGRESLLFRLDPKLSYVSDDFAAADTEFWRGK
jgi:hypothetical protein